MRIIWPHNIKIVKHIKINGEEKNSETKKEAAQKEFTIMLSYAEYLQK